MKKVLKKELPRKLVRSFWFLVRFHHHFKSQNTLPKKFEAVFLLFIFFLTLKWSLSSNICYTIKSYKFQAKSFYFTWVKNILPWYFLFSFSFIYSSADYEEFDNDNKFPLNITLQIWASLNPLKRRFLIFFLGWVWQVLQWNIFSGLKKTKHVRPRGIAR